MLFNHLLTHCKWSQIELLSGLIKLTETRSHKLNDTKDLQVPDTPVRVQKCVGHDCNTLIHLLCVFTVCYSPFPEVAESVQEELDTYRAQEDEVKRLKSIMVRSVGALPGVRGHIQGSAVEEVMFRVTAVVIPWKVLTCLFR